MTTSKLQDLLRRRKAGNVAVETGLLFPVVIALAAGMADYGFGVYDHMQLVSAVRAGAQYALSNADDAAAIQQVVENALTIDPAQVTVTVTQSCECPGGGTVSCDGSCDSGSVRKFITVAAEQQHQWLVAYPGLDNPSTLRADASIRTE